MLAGLEAKSEFLKTPAEARLLFLLFDRIGVDAVPTVIKENQRFFANYDDALWGSFSKELAGSAFLTTKTETAPEANDEIDRQLGAVIKNFTSRMPSIELSHYAEVSIYARLEQVLRPGGESAPLLPLNGKAMLDALDKAPERAEKADMLAVQTEFLFQSVGFLSRTLPLEPGTGDKLDLRKCFLAGLDWGKIDALHRTVDVEDAAIDSYDFEVPSEDLKWSQTSLDTLQNSTIEMICRPLVVKDDRFSDVRVAAQTTPWEAELKFGPLYSSKDPTFKNRIAPGCRY